MDFRFKLFTTRLLHTLLIALLGAGALAGCAPTPTVSPQAAAINAIRPILELPNLPLTYVETSHVGNSPDGTLQVERYDDSEGRKFYVDPQTNQVVEIDARSRLSAISTRHPGAVG